MNTLNLLKSLTCLANRLSTESSLFETLRACRFNRICCVMRHLQ